MGIIVEFIVAKTPVQVGGAPTSYAVYARELKVGPYHRQAQQALFIGSETECYLFQSKLKAMTS